MALPNKEDLYQTAVGAGLRVRPGLAMERDDVPAMQFSAGSAVGDRVIGVAVQESRAAFIDDAFGDRLKKRAAEQGVDWQPTSAAYGELTWTRPTALAEETVLAGSVAETDVDSAGKQSAATDIDLVLPIGVFSGTVPATATAVGSAGNVEAGGFSRTSVAGFTVTNAARFAGGNEDESEESLRERVRVKKLADREATFDAIEYHARRVAGVRVCTVVEDELGFLTAYVGDQDGNSNPSMVTAVTAALRLHIAAGAGWQVIGGSVLTQNVTVAVTARANTDTSALATRIQAAIRTEINKLKPGEILYRGAIEKAVRNVSDQITFVDVVLPAANLQPAATQSIRCGAVSFA